MEPLIAGEERVISLSQLWSLILNYISYLSVHNQISDPASLIESARRNTNVYDQLLQSMLDQMSKHGMPNDFPTDGSIFNRTAFQQQCTYKIISDEEEVFLERNSFWLEGVCQTVLGLFGIVGNLTAIVIYWSGGSKFYTIFYRLLICLLLVHTFYISLTIFVYFGRYHGSNFVSISLKIFHERR